jgi:hypothetical protein
MRCQRCGGEQFTKAGFSQSSQHLHSCTACQRRQMSPPPVMAIKLARCLMDEPYCHHRGPLPASASKSLGGDPRSQRLVLDLCVGATLHAALPGGGAALSLPGGRTWAVDETYIRVARRWQYAYRAIDEYGQVVDVYLSPARDAQAAERFFRCALEETEERPERVTTDRAACYPLALERVLPEAEHLMGKLIQQGIERDHQHLKGRTRPMRGFKTARGARVVCRGHGFLRNLRAGFYDLGGTLKGERHRPAVRLGRAWEALTTLLLAA